MPSTEQKQLAVHVIAETSSGYNNASGIVVAPGRVLTAGHVLDDATADLGIEIRFCALGPEVAKWIPATVCWDGRGWNRDAAVLAFDPEKLEPDSREICRSFSRCLIYTGPWGSHARWGSFGLPVFAWQTPKDGSKPIPAPTGLVGSVGSPNPHTDDLDLYADALPKDATRWMGASGSGVFIDHGLRAMIVEATIDPPNRLQALLLSQLFTLEGFHDAIDWSTERDWFKILARRVGALLSKPEIRKLCERLAEDLGLTTTEPTVVATALIALPAVEFLLMANRVAHGLIGDGEGGQDELAYKAAVVLEEIVEAGLAGKLGTALLSRVVLSTRAGSGDDFVKLPTMEVVLAEFYNAGLDGRPADVRAIPPDDHGGEMVWKDLRKEYPMWPHTCVPLNPAIGFAVKPVDWARTALSHVAQALGVSEIERSRSTPERLAEIVNDRLESLARTPDRAVPRRWYLLYVDGQDPAPARELKRLLPELRICAISKSEDREERRVEAALATAMSEFLDRKRKRANRR
jgi:hypothetical protein